MQLDQILTGLIVVAICIGVFYAYSLRSFEKWSSLFLFGVAGIVLAFAGAFCASFGKYDFVAILLLKDDGFLGFGRGYVGGLGIVLGVLLVCVKRVLGRFLKGVRK
jgi:hypothetical membrane protein